LFQSSSHVAGAVQPLAEQMSLTLRSWELGGTAAAAEGGAGRPWG
jgi:hypothetical protein